MPPGHFYSPLPSDADVRRALLRSSGDVGCLPGLDSYIDEQLELLRELAPHARAWPFPEIATPRFRYYSENGYYSKPDGVVLYAMLNHLRPGQIVEVGSGHSSALMLDALELNPSWGTNLTFVDPYPERLNSLMRPDDWQRCTVEARPVQEVDSSLFQGLRANDILFIDSSHVSKAGSDVHYLMFEVLPRLAPGVFVHIHDLFWPFEYPMDWYAEGLAWNEAYLVRAFLLYNTAFHTRLWLSQLQAVSAGAVAEIWPNPKPCHGEASGLWLRRA